MEKIDTSNSEKHLLNSYFKLFEVGRVFSWIVGILLISEIFVFALFPSITDPKQLLIDFSKNWFIGLLRFDLLGVISYLLLIPITIGLYVATKSVSKILALLGLTLFLVGVAMFLSTNTGFSVLSLSKQFANSVSDEERNTIIASCLSMIILFKVNAFMMSYIVVSGSWILLSIAMHRCSLFSKFTSVSGILAGSSGIFAEVLENSSDYLRWPAIVLYFLAIVFLIAWIHGIGVSFSRIYRPGSEMKSET